MNCYHLFCVVVVVGGGGGGGGVLGEEGVNKKIISTYRLLKILPSMLNIKIHKSYKAP